MKSIGFDFFATKEDLMPGIQAFEAEHEVQYVLAGLFDSPTCERYSSGMEIPDLGRSIYGHRAAERTYLVLSASAEVKIEPVPQRKGSTMYSVNLLLNPSGFAFRPSGVYGDHFIIDGSIGTATGNADSMRLCKEFIRKLRRGFTKIHSYYVGSEALRLMDEGVRLAASIHSPPEFDLRRPVETPGAELPRQTRLEYVESMHVLQRLGVLAPDEVPPLPQRRPRHDDPEPLGLSFHRSRLTDCSLDHLSLPRTFFCRSGIERVSFHKSDLSESTMCWNDFTDVDFTEADLRGSDLRRSVFENVRFVRSDLRDADLRVSDFDNCDFTGAEMAGAMLLEDQDDIFTFSAEQQDSIQWMIDQGEKPGGG